MMKMAPVSLITLFVLCCSRISSTDAQDGCDIYAPTGGNIDVPISIKLEESYTLKWLRNDSVIFYKRPGRNIQGKPEDIDSKGSLKLTKLKKSDSGKYTFEVYDKNGNGLTTTNNNVRLCVLDPVQKPTVEMKCLKDSQVQFTCKVQGKAHTTLEWIHNNKAWSEKVADTLIKPAKDLPNDVTCKVSNKASSATSDPIKHDCSKSMLDMKVLGFSIWIFVGGGAGVVVVLIIIVIICCVQTRRKKRMRLKDEGEFRLQWSRSEESPHQPHTHSDHDNHNHHHHHHANQQPAGHTGPRQNRSKQQRNQQRGRLPEPPIEQPQPSPRRPAQALPVDNADEEDPPPLPQPRKKGPRTRV